jgi:hypothetical protein
LANNIVKFGDSERLRMVPSAEGVFIHREKLLSATGKWREVSVQIIPNEAVGDTCAALSTHYDRLLDDKMRATKQRCGRHHDSVAGACGFP